MDWIQFEGRAFWYLFAASFIAMAIWETVRPLRPLTGRTERRWGIHAILMTLAVVLSVLVLRSSPVVLAAAVAHSRFGLLNRPGEPYLLRFLAGLLLIDLAKYAAHRTMHAVYWLWRAHQIHHSDNDFDVSTALRVHPLESLAIQVVMLATVALAAPPLAAVVVAELMSCFQSFFNHANASLPPALERYLRLFLITPDMHRIHHSTNRREQSANLGDIFPWWDHIFGTYVAEPVAGQQGMIMGLDNFAREKSLDVPFLLALPFARRPRA